MKRYFGFLGANLVQKIILLEIFDWEILVAKVGDTKGNGFNKDSTREVTYLVITY